MMKKLLLLVLMVATSAYASAQSKRVSVLGPPLSSVSFPPITRLSTPTTETMSMRLTKRGGASISRQRAIRWRRTTHGAAQPSAVQGTEEWILRKATSFLVWTALAILTSSLSSEEPTMPGRTRPLASISTPIGQRTTANISVLPLLA